MVAAHPGAPLHGHEGHAGRLGNGDRWLSRAPQPEFGKSPLLSAGTLGNLGYNVIIWPVTLLRNAMGATERLLATLRDTGTQERAVPDMQTRARLYELINYESYTAFDADIFNFEIPGESA